MKLLFTILLFFSTITLVYATDNNKTAEAIKKAIAKEKKIAKEQRFYQGSEYNLKDAEVDPESVSKIKVIEPEYDFDMDTGVYDD